MSAAKARIDRDIAKDKEIARLQLALRVVRVKVNRLDRAMQIMANDLGAITDRITSELDQPEEPTA